MLRALCQHLRNHSAHQAAVTLELLQFERLLQLIEDPTGNLHFTDAATSLGVERVFETGDHILGCRLALLREDLESALSSAQEALRRWKQNGLETDPSNDHVLFVVQGDRQYRPFRRQTFPGRDAVRNLLL
jgi:hypothetical protein